VNKKCLVSGPVLFEDGLNCCEVREVDDDDYDDDIQAQTLSSLADFS
jgi:hypothetical protein